MLWKKFDNNNVYSSLGLNRFKFDKNMSFYNLDANLFNLGWKDLVYWENEFS